MTTALQEAIEDAYYQGEGVEEILYLRVGKLTDKRLRSLLMEHLADVNPYSQWNRRPGHEARLAAAERAMREARTLLSAYAVEAALPTANSGIPAKRLCLQLAIEDYWAAEVLERWGRIDGFSLHAYTDARGAVRVAFTPDGGSEPAFELRSTATLDEIQKRTRRTQPYR